MRLLLLACLVPWLSGQAADRPVLEGTVVRVVDGDTADVRLHSGVIRVRLHAIDAPEMDQPHGADAKRGLATLVLRKKVHVEPYEQDDYHRLVGRLWLGDLDVDAELVRLGHAWTYRRYADDPVYCALEQSARDQGRGLWSLPRDQRVAPWEWRHRQGRRTAFTDYSAQSVAACVASLGR